MGRYAPFDQRQAAGEKSAALQQPSAAQVLQNPSPQMGGMGQMSLGVPVARSYQALGRIYRGSQQNVAIEPPQAGSGESEAKSLERYAIQQSVQAEQRSQQYANAPGISGLYVPSRRERAGRGGRIPACPSPRIRLPSHVACLASLRRRKLFFQPRSRQVPP